MILTAMKYKHVQDAFYAFNMPTYCKAEILTLIFTVKKQNKQYKRVCFVKVRVYLENNLQESKDGYRITK